MKTLHIYIISLLFAGIASDSHADMIPVSRCYIEGDIVSFPEIKKSYLDNPTDQKTVETTSKGVRINITSIRPESGVDNSCQLARPGIYSDFKPISDFEITEFEAQKLKMGDKIKGIVHHTGDEYGIFFGFTKIEKLSASNLQ